MALVLADRVLETTTTAGSGTITLAGAEPGYQSFSAVGDGNQTYYTITADTDWEVGIGTYTASGTTLSRDTVLSSSNSNAKVTFPAGVKKVFVTYPAERSVYENAAGSLVLSQIDVTTLTATSATITTLTATSASVTNLTLTSLVLSNLSIASANITTLTSTNATAASLTVSTGNLTFSSTGQRITGDFSNATLSNRLSFQTSTPNGNTPVQIVPNGTAVQTQIGLFSDSAFTNGNYGDLTQNNTEFRIRTLALGSGTAVPMTFSVNGSERMRLDTSGNLGIGTASPAANLNVAKSADGIAARFQRSSGGCLVDIETYNGIGGIGTADNIPFRLNTNNTERMRLDSSGNVGIGTTSPSSYGRLGVMTPTANYGFFGIANSAGGAGGVQMAQYYSTVKISYIDTTLTNGTPGSETAYLAFATANSGTLAERMRIDSSGNVGIGTVSPGTKLTVSSATNAGISVTDGTVTTIMYNSTGGVGSIGTTSNHPVDFYTNNAARMRIDSSGNVGIGTASPSYKLSVSGTIQSSTGGFRFPDGTTQTTAASAGLPSVVVTASTSISAVAGNHYVLTAATTATVTLPASPTISDTIYVTVANNLTTNVIARNGKNIQGLAEDMTLNAPYASAQLRFTNNATEGWILA